jgi:RES domain-containing protein
MRAQCAIISTIWRLVALHNGRVCLRFTGRAYRAHDPRWSFDPVSGRGVAITGGRFNVKGQEALYLSLSPVTALVECTQGFANRMLPLTVCEYDIDCEGIADLTNAGARVSMGVAEPDIACGWLAFQRKSKIAPSQAAAKRLRAKGFNGALVPSFVPGIDAGAVNLVLWKWSDSLPCKVAVYDPEGRLPTGKDGIDGNA